MDNIDRGPAPQPEAFDVVKWTRISWLAVIALLAATIVGVLIWFFVSFASIDIKEKGVSCVYPRGWRIERPKQSPDVIAAFVSPQENALDAFFENMVLTSYDMSRKPLSTDQYIELMVRQMKAVFSNITLVKKSLFFPAGRKGCHLLFRVEDDVPKMISVYAFTIGEMGYNFLYIGVEDRYFKEKPLMDVMALLLKVKY